MLDFLNSFPAMIAKNIFTFCRDLYQNRLRSLSISYVFTRYIDYLSSNSLKKRFLFLAFRIILNLLHEKYKSDGEEICSDKSDDNTNTLFTIDELKLGFFFQHSHEYEYQARYRKVNA